MRYVVKKGVKKKTVREKRAGGRAGERAKMFVSVAKGRNNLRHLRNKTSDTSLIDFDAKQSMTYWG